MKKILGFLMIFSLILTLTACQVGKAETANNISKDDPNKKHRVGFANLNDSFPFCSEVKQGIVTEAEKAGFEIVLLDNNLDKSITLSNADKMIVNDIDFFIEFNTIYDVAEEIMGKMNKANVPVIAIDIKHPGASFMGADNVKAGMLGGIQLAKYAKELWNGKIDYLVLIEDPAVGDANILRMDSYIDGLKETYKDFPDNKVVKLDGKNTAINAKIEFLKFLNANKNAKNILVGTLNAENAEGVVAAAKEAKRESDVIIVSQNVPEVLDIMEASDSWKAGITYNPDKYGSYIIPAIKDYFAGKEMPKEILMKHTIVEK